jgi:hypothetical protein
MNVRQGYRRLSLRRITTCVRLMAGGAIAGIFVGSILGAMVGLALPGRFDGVVAGGGVLLGLAGAVWGLVLACSDEPGAPPSVEMRRIES